MGLRMFIYSAAESFVLGVTQVHVASRGKNFLHLDVGFMCFRHSWYSDEAFLQRAAVRQSNHVSHNMDTSHKRWYTA